MPLGILQTSLYPEDAGKSFQLAAQLGADGIQLVCPSQEQVASLTSDEGASKVAAWKKKHSLQVPGITLTALSEVPSLFSDPAAAAGAADLIHEAMAAAKNIGAPVLVLPCLGKASIASEEQLDKLIEALHELA